MTDQPDQPVTFFDNDPGKILELDGVDVRVCRQNFGQGPHGGQGGAQLVGDIGYHIAALDFSPCQTFSHLIEGFCKLDMGLLQFERLFLYLLGERQKLGLVCRSQRAQQFFQLFSGRDLNRPARFDQLGLIVHFFLFDEQRNQCQQPQVRENDHHVPVFRHHLSGDRLLRRRLGRGWGRWRCAVMRALRIVIDDHLETDRVISDLMGRDASARFRFIMDRAEDAELAFIRHRGTHDFRSIKREAVLAAKTPATS